MMTSRITEFDIEALAIELLENQGYQYIYGPDIAPDTETPLPLGEAGVRALQDEASKTFSYSIA